MNILIIILFLLFSSFQAQGQTPTPTPGGLCAGTVTTDSVAITVVSDPSNGGGHVWINPAQGSNGCNDSGAGADFSSSGTTEYLKATNYAFVGIPNDAVINGIGLTVEKRGFNGVTTDVEVRLVKANGSLSSANRASGSPWSTTGSDGVSNYGGASDAWGESWVGADINDTDFGAVISATYSGTTSAPGVDCMVLSVCWSAAVPTPTPTPPCTVNADCHLNCCGDCDQDGEVSGAELYLCNQIHLGNADIAECPECDCDINTLISSTDISIIKDNTTECCEQNGACVGNMCVTVTPTFTPTLGPTITAGPEVDSFDNTPAGTPTATGTPTVTPTLTNTLPPDSLPLNAKMQGLGSANAKVVIAPSE